MKLTRRTDWQTQLDELVIERRAMPFAWGINDCATFAVEAVLRMTGTSILPTEIGPWATAKQAFRALKPFGGLANAVRASGLCEVGPRFAQRGDLVLVRAPGRPRSLRGALGICLGERIAAPGLHGLVMANLGDGGTAWRV
jgi:hypothetical protein